jgi:type VI secretion system protein VasG
MAGNCKDRLNENHAVEFRHDDNLISEIARRCTEVESGARSIDNILTNTLLPEISRELLGRMAEEQKMGVVQVGIGAEGKFVYS